MPCAGEARVNRASCAVSVFQGSRPPTPATTRRRSPRPLPLPILPGLCKRQRQGELAPPARGPDPTTVVVAVPHGNRPRVKLDNPQRNLEAQPVPPPAPFLALPLRKALENLRQEIFGNPRPV